MKGTFNTLLCHINLLRDQKNCVMECRSIADVQSYILSLSPEVVRPHSKWRENLILYVCVRIAEWTTAQANGNGRQDFGKSSATVLIAEPKDVFSQSEEKLSRRNKHTHPFNIVCYGSFNTHTSQNIKLKL